MRLRRIASAVIPFAVGCVLLPAGSAIAQPGVDPPLGPVELDSFTNGEFGQTNSNQAGMYAELILPIHIDEEFSSDDDDIVMYVDGDLVASLKFTGFDLTGVIKADVKFWGMTFSTSNIDIDADSSFAGPNDTWDQRRPDIYAGGVPLRDHYLQYKNGYDAFNHAQLAPWAGTMPLCVNFNPYPQSGNKRIAWDLDAGSDSYFLIIWIGVDATLYGITEVRRICYSADITKPIVELDTNIYIKGTGTIYGGASDPFKVFTIGVASSVRLYDGSMDIELETDLCLLDALGGADLGNGELKFGLFVELCTPTLCFPYLGCLPQLCTGKGTVWFAFTPINLALFKFATKFLQKLKDAGIIPNPLQDKLQDIDIDFIGPVVFQVRDPLPSNNFIDSMLPDKYTSHSGFVCKRDVPVSGIIWDFCSAPKDIEFLNGLNANQVLATTQGTNTVGFFNWGYAKTATYNKAGGYELGEYWVRIRAKDQKDNSSAKFTKFINDQIAISLGGEADQTEYASSMSETLQPFMEDAVLRFHIPGAEPLDFLPGDETAGEGAAHAAQRGLTKLNELASKSKFFEFFTHTLYDFILWDTAKIDVVDHTPPTPTSCPQSVVTVEMETQCGVSSNPAQSSQIAAFYAQSPFEDHCDPTVEVATGSDLLRPLLDLFQINADLIIPFNPIPIDTDFSDLDNYLPGEVFASCNLANHEDEECFNPFEQMWLKVTQEYGDNLLFANFVTFIETAIACVNALDFDEYWPIRLFAFDNRYIFDTPFHTGDMCDDCIDLPLFNITKLSDIGNTCLPANFPRPQIWEEGNTKGPWQIFTENTTEALGLQEFPGGKPKWWPEEANIQPSALGNDLLNANFNLPPLPPGPPPIFDGEDWSCDRKLKVVDTTAPRFVLNGGYVGDANWNPASYPSLTCADGICKKSPTFKEGDDIYLWTRAEDPECNFNPPFAPLSVISRIHYLVKWGNEEFPFGPLGGFSIVKYLDVASPQHILGLKQSEVFQARNIGQPLNAVKEFFDRYPDSNFDWVAIVEGILAKIPPYLPSVLPPRPPLSEPDPNDPYPGLLTEVPYPGYCADGTYTPEVESWDWRSKRNLLYRDNGTSPVALESPEIVVENVAPTNRRSSWRRSVAFGANWDDGVEIAELFFQEIDQSQVAIANGGNPSCEVDDSGTCYDPSSFPELFEGEPLRLRVEALDPGCDDKVLSYSIDWKDPYDDVDAPETGYVDANMLLNVSHVFDHIYCQDGLYTPEFTFTDSDGASTTYTFYVTVRNFEPIVKIRNPKFSSVIDTGTIEVEWTAWDKGCDTWTADIFNKFYERSFFTQAVGVPMTEVTDGGGLPIFEVFDWGMLDDIIPSGQESGPLEDLFGAMFPTLSEIKDALQAQWAEQTADVFNNGLGAEIGNVKRIEGTWTWDTTLVPESDTNRIRIHVNDGTATTICPEYRLPLPSLYPDGQAVKCLNINFHFWTNNRDLEVRVLEPEEPFFNGTAAGNEVSKQVFWASEPTRKSNSTIREKGSSFVTLSLQSPIPFRREAGVYALAWDGRANAADLNDVADQKSFELFVEAHDLFLLGPEVVVRNVTSPHIPTFAGGTRVVPPALYDDDLSTIRDIAAGAPTVVDLGDTLTIDYILRTVILEGGTVLTKMEIRNDREEVVKTFPSAAGCLEVNNVGRRLDGLPDSPTNRTAKTVIWNWDMTDDNGDPVPYGAYQWRITAQLTNSNATVKAFDHFRETNTRIGGVLVVPNASDAPIVDTDSNGAGSGKLSIYSGQPVTTDGFLPLEVADAYETFFEYNEYSAGYNGSFYQFTGADADGDKLLILSYNRDIFRKEKVATGGYWPDHNLDCTGGIGGGTSCDRMADSAQQIVAFDSDAGKVVPIEQIVFPGKQLIMAKTNLNYLTVMSSWDVDPPSVVDIFVNSAAETFEFELSDTVEGLGIDVDLTKIYMDGVLESFSVSSGASGDTMFTLNGNITGLGSVIDIDVLAKDSFGNRATYRVMSHAGGLGPAQTLEYIENVSVGPVGGVVVSSGTITVEFDVPAGNPMDVVSAAFLGGAEDWVIQQISAGRFKAEFYRNAVEASLHAQCEGIQDHLPFVAYDNQLPNIGVLYGDIFLANGVNYESEN